MGGSSSMPEHFTHFIGCQAFKQNDVDRCFHDGSYLCVTGNVWMPEESMGYVFEKPALTRKNTHTQTARNVKMDVHRDYKLDPEVHGLSQYSQIGIYDSQSRSIQADGAIQVARDKKGKFSTQTNTKIRQMVKGSKGTEVIKYHFFLPCARIATNQVIGPQKNSWVTGVIVGASVTGEISRESFGDEGTSVGFDARGGAPFNFNSNCIAGAFEQIGGPDIQRAKWQSKPLSDFFRYLEEKWRTKTLASPETWTVQRLIVREAEVDEKFIQEQEASSTHVVTVGRMGVGKSKFLTQLAGGKEIFKSGNATSGADKGNNMAAVTLNVETRTVNVDYGCGTKSLMLTDVPGFGDPRKFGDERTVQNLMEELNTPGYQTIHAVVLVEKFGEQRFSDQHTKFLQELERNFGERMWDYFVIMLTHFQDHAGKEMSENHAANDRTAHRMLEDVKKAWIAELKQWFPSSRNKIGNNTNIVYAIDSVAWQQYDTMSEGQKKQKANKVTAWFGEWSKQQMKSFNEQTQGRLKSGNFLRVADAVSSLRT